MSKPNEDHVGYQLARSKGFQQTWFEQNRTTRSWATTKYEEKKKKKDDDEKQPIDRRPAKQDGGKKA